MKGPGLSLGQSANKLQLIPLPNGEGEKIAFTLYFLIFFHFTASKSIQNRLSNCLNFRRKAFYALSPVLPRALPGLSPPQVTPLLGQGWTSRLPWAHPLAWGPARDGEGLQGVG